MESERGGPGAMEICGMGRFGAISTWFVHLEFLLASDLVLMNLAAGSYVLYTYMIAQRRKIMKGKQVEKRNRAVTQ